MSHDKGFGELPVQLSQQLFQRFPLGGCTGVFGRAAISGQTTDVTDTYAVAVVIHTVCARNHKRTGVLNGAVGGDDIVVTAVLPAFTQMPCPNVRHAEYTALHIGRAVYNDQCNGTHGVRSLEQIRTQGTTGSAGQYQFQNSHDVEQNALPGCLFHTCRF